MGHKQDQNFPGDTYRPSDNPGRPEQTKGAHNPVPPLPPRAGAVPSSSPLHEHLDAPPAYTETPAVYYSQSLSRSLSSQDPRSSSTQSLIPRPTTEETGKRTLLLIYIHGFLGNETSFQSFPAHVHNVVTVKLAETHVVHTKIYPKYKSRKHIEFARDVFSEWLRPHEASDTDIMILGHSMGGILSAEVALLEKHRILGTINFDTPFLGMHPGVIASGLGSLFKPAPDSPALKPTEARTTDHHDSSTTTDDVTQSSVLPSLSASDASFAPAPAPTETNSTATLPLSSPSSLDLPTNDPNYDPPFVNDIRLPQRTGWANALHFINKHSDGLTKAAQTYVKSHLEFGGAMADYNGLKRRYQKVRTLEDGKTSEGNRATRVRFVNYYTASTGRPKKPNEPSSAATLSTEAKEANNETSTLGNDVQRPNLQAPRMSSPSVNPRTSKENENDASLIREEVACTDENFLSAPEYHIKDEGNISDSSMLTDPNEMAATMHSRHNRSSTNHESPAGPESAVSSATSDTDLTTKSSSSFPRPIHEAPNLPPIPPAPEEPPPFNSSSYTDKDTCKLAEKDYARQVKAYKQAIKDREKAINDRRKFLEKREKNSIKEREKQVKAEERERLKLEQRGMEKGERERAKLERGKTKRQEKAKAKTEKEALKKAAKESRKLGKSSAGADPEAKKDEKPKREKHFCMLPPKINGQIDRCWVRVFMPGVDEVGAHCGLFFADGERYQSFVADVAERIKVWVWESGG